MATAPLRSGFAETSSSRRVLGSPLWYRVGPWPAILAHRRRRLLVAAGDRRPVALHHLVGDAAPQHRPALVYQAGEEGVCLVVGDSFLVVDAAVQRDVDAEGQKSHAASLGHTNAGCGNPSRREAR